MHITEPLPGDKRARLVFGLDWRAYPFKDKKDSRARYAEDFSATHFVSMTLGEVEVAGFCAPEAADLKRVTLYSGAARIAMLERVRSKPAVLVLMQDGQRVHLVYVVRGVVENDEVLTLAQAARRREEILQRSRRQGLALVVLAAGADIPAGDEPFQPGELLALKKVAPLKRVPAGIPNAVVLLLVVAIAGFGIKEMAGVFNPPPIVAKGPDWTQRYNQALKKAFSGVRPMASQLAPALLAQFDWTETNRTGFQFDHAVCGSTGTCTVTWLRMGGAFEDFARGAPASMLPIAFDRAGRTLAARGPVVPKVDAVSPTQRAQWPDEQTLIESLQTPAQRLSVKPVDLNSFGYVVRIEPTHALLSAPPPASEHHGALVREGKWEIDGYRWQAPLLEHLPADMTLETLEVKLDTSAPEELGKVGIHFVAKGKYYVVQ